MLLRPKTKRRAGILLLVTVLVLAAATGFYAFRLHRIDADLDRCRREGMEAAGRGDNAAAIKLLANYLRHRKADLPAMKALALCSSLAPSPDGSNLAQAIDVYARYCDLNPSDTDAQYRLLDLEQRHPRYAGQALSLATSLLQNNPNDATALLATARIYQHQHRYGPALDAALKAARLRPDDLEIQRLSLLLMKLNGCSSDDLDVAATAFAVSHPADARVSLLEAFACWYCRDPAQIAEQNARMQAQARRLILTAAAGKLSDRPFVLLAVGLLERLRLFDEARDLLAGACQQVHDDELTVELVRRLWQNDRFEDVLKLLDEIPVSSQTDSRLIAFKAMTLAALGQADTARPLAADLSARTGEARALAWSNAIAARDLADPGKRLAMLRQAIQYDPDEPVLRAMLGDAYGDIGLNDLAVQQMRQAGDDAPAWAYPHIRIASLLASGGQGAGAEAERQTQRLAGAVPPSQSLAGQIACCQVRFARLQNAPKPAQAADLLADIEKLTRSGAAMPRQLLPIYASLLAQVGRKSQAIDAITAAENQPETDQETLLKLAAVSHNAGLGQEQELYEQSRQRFGLTAQLALAVAMQKLKQGRAAEGFKFLQEARSGSDAVAWDRTICLYREAAGDPKAAQAWRQLGDAYPDDLGVQSTIVFNEDSAWADRPFMSRSIDRLKALTGDDAVAWKLLRARWFLESPEPGKDASAVVALLGDVVCRWPDLYLPHMLMAKAYQQLADSRVDDVQRQSDLAGAVGEWKLAAEAAPNSPQALCNLAEACRYAGRFRDAGNVYRLLAAGDSIDASTIALAADFFASRCDLQTARQMLARLDRSGLAPGHRQLILADFDEKYSGTDAAAGDYAAAAAQDPDDPDIALRQIGFLMRQLRWPQARACLQEACARWPNDGQLAGQKSILEELSGIEPTDHLAAFVAWAVRDPVNPAARKAAAVLSEHLPAPRALGDLTDLLGEYPDFEPLYLLVIDQKLRMGQLEEAVALADKAMSRFARSADAAEASARLHVMAKDWRGALRAGQEWLRRSADGPLGPDRAIAAAEIFLGQPDQAAACLAPYMPAATKDPLTFVDPIMEYSEALIRAGREGQAVALLEPLARQSAVFRIRWLAIAISAHNDADSTLQWIELVHPLLASDSLPEQKALAETYLAVGRKYDNSKAYQRARDTLQPFRDKGDPDIMSLYNVIP